MSKIHYFVGEDNNLKWEGVKESNYPDEELKGITKYLLIGPEDQANNFELRLFQFEPGSRSDLVRYEKDYAFYILEGTTRLQINTEYYELKTRDVVYVSKDELIQFVNDGIQPLRFLYVTVASNKL